MSFFQHRGLRGFKYTALWLLFPEPIANAIMRLCVTDKTPFQSQVLVPIYTNDRYSLP